MRHSEVYDFLGSLQTSREQKESAVGGDGADRVSSGH